MTHLSSIVHASEDAFLAKYQGSILPSHKKALAAIKRCRKTSGPMMLAQCSNDECGKKMYIPHSCGHRSCPHCQSHENQQWIENQLSKQLPAPYYLITFTIPRELRSIAFRKQRIFYSLMFQAVQGLLKTFTENDSKLQGNPGFTTVLHTHTRRLDYHPHIHVLMVGGSINKKTRAWRYKAGKYLFNHRAMAKVFRAKLLKTMVDNNLTVPHKCPQKWVVDCRNVGRGDKALIYLGSYLYKGVVKEKDILKYDGNLVTFRYLEAKSRRYRTRTLSGEDFLWLLMQHVLPSGFRKVRCYGFLHPCSKGLIKLLQLILGFNTFLRIKKRPRPGIICKCCGAAMQIIGVMIPGVKLSQVMVPL